MPPVHGASADLLHARPTLDELNQLDEADKEQLEEEEAVRLALAELEEAELQEFVALASTQVSEVRIGLGADHHYLRRRRPQLKDHSGRWRYYSYGISQLRYFATNLPSDMLCPEESYAHQYSLKAIRNSLTRLYMVVPPQRLVKFLKAIRSIYMWEDPIDTAKWLIIYLFALYWDLLVAFAVGTVICYCLRPRLYPPKAAEIRKLVKEQMRRTKEAQAFGKYMERRDQAGLLGATLAEAVSVAGLGSIGHPMKPPSADTEVSDDLDEGAPQQKGKRTSTYRILKQVNKDLGPLLQMVLDDFTALSQKVKNLLLWRNERATRRLLLVYSIAAIGFSAIPTGVLVRLFEVYLGFHFFVLCQVQDRCPQYRRALHPLFWWLYGIPTDAEAALQILQRRSHRSERAVILPLKVVPAEPDAADDPKETSRRKRWSKRISNTFKKAKESDQEDADESSDDEEDGLAYFALYKKTPGQLIINAPYVSFYATRGFGRLSKKLQANFTDYTPSLKDMAALQHAKQAEGNSRLLLRLMLSDITGIRKDGGLVEGDSIEILRGEESFIFTQLRGRRDEAFSFLLASCPSHFVVG